MLKLRIIKQFNGVGDYRFALQEEKYEQRDGNYWDWAKEPCIFDKLDPAIAEAKKRLQPSWLAMNGVEVVWDSEEARKKVLNNNGK